MSYRSNPRWISGGASLVVVLLAGWTTAAFAGPPACGSGCVTAIAVQHNGKGPFGVTAGPRGSEWFSLGQDVARVDERGNVTTYQLPSVGPNAGWLTDDPSRGLVWVAERGAGAIAAVSPSGQILELALPDRADSLPQSIVPAPNGLVYVTDQEQDTIVAVDPATSTTTSYEVPTADAAPLGAVLGPDGAVWFVERDAAKVGRMTLDGTFAEWSLGPDSSPQRITVGPDGALWFSELDGEAVARITTGGALTEYPLAGGPVGITRGEDGQLYVALFQAGQLARLAPNGAETGHWDLPGAQFTLQVATGRGHDLWVSDSSGNLFRVTPYETGQG